MRFIWWVIFFHSIAGAAPLESHYLAYIASARDPRAVEHLMAQYEELKITRAACRIQLRDQNVPTACYLALRLENNLHMHPTEMKTGLLRAQLDSRCRQAALTADIPPATDEAVSPACAKWLREARAIVAYRTRGQDG